MRGIAHRCIAIWLWDIFFIFCAACYAWLAFAGIMPISGNGTIIDSDLMTYAQGMAGASHPELFHVDPVLKNASAANSIHTLERTLASWLAAPGQWAAGLLLAGAICIFVFYTAWYLLGRWLYGSPSLAALLSVVCGTTVWIGWGTFWGISHSDPLPRVFFGALMPLLLFLALLAMRRPLLRPVAMAAAGLFMWVHGVSALNYGAMIFTAFALIPAPGVKLKAHIFNLCLCLAAFFAPVLYFLWPSLFQPRQFTPDELAIFQELMELRWHEDYAGFGRRMLAFFSPFGQVFPVLAGGAAAWLVTMLKGNGRERLFCHMCPCFALALALVAAFCWAESHFSMRFGRLPMGHELVRGMRFLIPVAWVCIAAGIGCLAGPWLRRFFLCAAIGLILVFSTDRQYMAAQYAITEFAGIPTPLAVKAEAEKKRADSLQTFLEEIPKIVPAGEAVYAPEDAMQTRYIALRPLAHSYKDGYVHFYNKDYEGSRRWLNLEKLARSAPDGWIKAWEESGAPWLLARSSFIGKTGSSLPGRIALEKNGWILVRHE